MTLLQDLYLSEVLTNEQQRQDIRKLPIRWEERVGAELLPERRLPGWSCVHSAAFHAAGKDPGLFHVILLL